jgi:hypothetical protein
MSIRAFGNFTTLLLVFVGSLCLSSFRSFAAQEMPRWATQGASVEASSIDAGQQASLAAWLDRNGRPPLEYAVEICREHQIVFFGESHGKREPLEFFQQLIPEAYYEAGMRCVVLEVAKHEDNDRLARLVEGTTFDRALALDIARNSAWGNWYYQEYWDVLEVVWKLNRDLPAGAEPMRVVGMDTGADLQLNWMWMRGRIKDPELQARARREFPLLAKRDELMAAVIELEVIRKGAKAMVLVGFNHSFTHYAQPRVNADGMLRGEWPRMANILYQAYGDRIFQIGFHFQHFSPKNIWPAYKGGEPVFTDVVEKIMALRADQPVGWDVLASPFAGIRDRQSYFFHFQPRVNFGDICRGCIFLRPCGKISACRPIKNFITEDMFKKSRGFFEARFNRTFNTVDELNEFMEKFGREI